MQTLWNAISTAHDLLTLNELLDSLSCEEVLLLTETALDDVIGANFVGCSAPALHPPPFLSQQITQLNFDVNEPYAKARSLPQLLLAKLAVVDRKKLWEAYPRASLLAFRVLLIWQKILREPCLSLKNMIDNACEQIENNIADDEKSVYWLERANSHLIYYEYDKCAECIQRALEHSNLNMELAGKLGKRTRFQRRDIAQLVLSAKSTTTGPTCDDPDVPTNCSLNDDTLLENISLAEEGYEGTSLTPVQLSVVLAIYRLERKSEHCDDLFMEKADAYLEAIIRQRRCWPVQVAALLARSDLERTKKRRVERACAQSELICKIMDGMDDETSNDEKRKRCKFVLASGLEPFWAANCIQAETLQSLGCTSEALLLYEKLEMWDSVIGCFKQLGQLEKAEALVRRLLEERPNDSMLFCLLGDITMEASYYETAIKMTGDRNARARKSLGNLMLLRKQFQVAYEHLRRSLELQPIQISFEPEHFEAWNNLSAAYIKLGQKERAASVLQEALKCNFEHPKVWENYLLLCVDTAQFDQAIKAFHRLLDLNKQQKDDEVLGIITENVLRMSQSSDDLSKAQGDNLKTELVKLFGRLTSVQTLSSKAWKAYASLKRPTDENVEDGEKYVQLLERALQAESNKPNWSKDADSCYSVLSSAIELATERLRFASLRGEAFLKQAKSRVRISLKPLVTVAKRELECNKENSGEKWEEVNNCLNKIEMLLTEVSS